MKYFDGSRITADSYKELRSYAEKINAFPLLHKDNMLFTHAYNLKHKIAVEKSTQMRRVSADEFDNVCLRLTVPQLKGMNDAYSNLSRKPLHTGDKKTVNGRVYEKVGTYKATGELELFKEIVSDRIGSDGVLRSQISGQPLIQDVNNNFFVNQFAHCLPKSLYWNYRLNKENIFLMTVKEHELQTINPNKTKEDTRYNTFWETYNRLREKYNKEYKR